MCQFIILVFISVCILIGWGSFPAVDSFATEILSEEEYKEEIKLYVFIPCFSDLMKVAGYDKHVTLEYFMGFLDSREENRIKELETIILRQVVGKSWIARSMYYRTVQGRCGEEAKRVKKSPPK